MAMNPGSLALPRPAHPSPPPPVPGEREDLSLSRLRERVGVRVPGLPQKPLLSFIANQVR